MINRIRQLLFLQLKSAYGINVLLHTRDPRAKRKSLLMLIIYGMLFLILFGYMAGITFVFYRLGMLDLLFVFVSAVAAIVPALIGLFAAGSLLYGKSASDYLLALPVTNAEITLSGILLLYLENLLIAAVAALPSFFIYAIFARPSFPYYPLALLCLLLLPLLPTAFSTVFGTLVRWLSSFFKRKALWEALLSFALLGAILCFTSSVSMPDLSSLTEEKLAQMLSDAIKGLSSSFPFLQYIDGALRLFDGKCLLCFALIELLPFVLACWAAARVRPSLISAIERAPARTVRSSKNEQAASALTALVKKEFRRYFSSGVYVTNTMCGPFFALALSAALLFLDLDKLLSMLPFSLPLPLVAPLAVALVASLMPPAAVSVSMEGKNWLFLKTLPVQTKNVYGAKMLMTFLLYLPFDLVCSALLIIALKPAPLYIITIPASLVAFSALTSALSFSVGRAFASFDWDSEVACVKQSASAFFGSFCCLLLFLVLTAAALFLPAAAQPFAALFLPAAALLAAFLLCKRLFSASL